MSLWVVGCGNGDSDDGSPSTPPPDSTPSDNTAADSAFAQAMIAAHNALRANAAPAPSPALPPLTWSVEAAQKAQAWAAQCKLASNPDPGGFGENIGGSTAYKVRTAQMVQQVWGAEAVSYDYDKNTCAAGKICGQYTQIVWRNTTQVGCALNLCTENSPFASVSQWELWVCYYTPAGNQADQRPY